MDLTKEDYEILTSYIPLIETIVRNASCSNIPLDFRTAIVNMGKKYKTISCDSCNRELYRVYADCTISISSIKIS